MGMPDYGSGTRQQEHVTFKRNLNESVTQNSCMVCIG